MEDEERVREWVRAAIASLERNSRSSSSSSEEEEMKERETTTPPPKQQQPPKPHEVGWPQPTPPKTEEEKEEERRRREHKLRSVMKVLQKVLLHRSTAAVLAGGVKLVKVLAKLKSSSSSS